MSTDREKMSEEILDFLEKMYDRPEVSHLDIIYALCDALKTVNFNLLEFATEEAKSKKINYLSKELHKEVAEDITKSFAPYINDGKIIEFELIYIFASLSKVLFTRIDQLDAKFKKKDKSLSDDLFEIDLDEEQDASKLDKIIDKFKNL